MKKKRRRIKYKKKKYMLYYIIFGILLLTTSTLLSVTVFFNIEEINITGKTKNKKEDILNVCSIKKGDNLILTDTKKSEKMLFNNFKNLDYVKVKKTFPNSLEIECEDAILDFYCKKDNDTYILVSKNFRVFADNVEKKPKSGFLLETESKTTNFNAGDFFEISKEEEEKLKSLKEIIKNEKIKNITKIKLKDETTKITFENRITLEIEDFSKAAYLIKFSLKILKNSIGSLDKGKLVYLESNKSLHFIPYKKPNIINLN